MGCCALGTCESSRANGGDGCHLCDVVAAGEADARWPDYRRDPFSSRSVKRVESNPARDGDPKLAAERKREGVSLKRKRLGGLYVPPARRV